MSLFSERRLIFQVPPQEKIETISERIVRSRNLEEARQATEEIDNVNEDERSEILTSVEKKLEGMDQKQKELVYKSLTDLQKEMTRERQTQETAITVGFTGSLLDSLRAQLPPVPLASDQPADQEKKGFREGITDMAVGVTNILPERVTANMSRNQRALLGGAMTLGVGITAAYILKKLFGRAKDSVEEGKEAAEKSSGGFFKKALLFAGIGLGAFFGINYLLDKKFAKAKEEAIAAGKAAVDQARDAAKSATEAVQDALKPKTDSNDEEDQENPEENGESTPLSAEILSSSVGASALLRVFGDGAEELDIEIFERESQDLLSEVLGKLNNKKIKITEILSKSPEALSQEIYGEYSNENKVKMFTFVRRVIEQNEQRLRAQHAIVIQDPRIAERLGTSFEDLTFDHATSLLFHSSQHAIGNFAENVPEIIKNIGSPSALVPILEKSFEKAENIALNEYAFLLEKIPEEDRKFVRIENIQAFIKEKPKLNEVNENNLENMNEQEKKLIRVLLEEIQGYVPIKDGSLLDQACEGDKKIKDAIQKNWEKIRVPDAMQFFFGHAHKNTFVLRLKIVHFLSKYDTEEFAYASTVLISQFIQTASGAAARILAGEVSDLPPEMQKIARMITREAMNRGDQTLKSFYGLMQTPAGLVALGATGGMGSLAAYRAWEYFVTPWDEYMEKRLDAFSKTTDGPWRKFFSTRLRKEALLRAQTINSNTQEIFKTIRLFKGEGTKELREAFRVFHRDGYHVESFNTFRKAVQDFMDLNPSNAQVVRECNLIVDKLDTLQSFAKEATYLRFWLPKRVGRALLGKPAASRIPIDVDPVPGSAPVNEAPVRVQQTPEELAEAQKAARMDELLKDEYLARLIKESGKTPEEAAEFLNKIKDIDADTFIRIKESRGARKLLAGAVQTGKLEEVNHILKVANRAAKLRITLNAAGVVGDAFCIAMMFVDLAENQGRIDSTDNEQLKMIYRQADLLYYAEGASGVAGITLFGVAMVNAASAGAGLATAASVSSGLVLLPIAVATLSARYTYQKLERSAEYHTLTERDLVQFQPGKILQHINESSMGRLNFSQTLAEWVPTDSWTSWGGEYDPDAANLGAKHEGYRAYFSQIAVNILPPPTPFDLDMPMDKVQKLTPEQLQVALKAHQQLVYSRFVFDALGYISYKTGKEFKIQGTEALKNAQMFAIQQYEKRSQNPEQGYPILRWSDTEAWRKLEAEMSIEMKNHENSIEEELVEMSIDSEKFEAGAPRLIFGFLSHELAQCELKILNTDFSGVADDWERTAARGRIAWVLRDEVSKLVADSRNGKISSGSITSTLRNCRDVLEADPDPYAKEAADSPYGEFYAKHGSNTFALTAPSLLQLIDQYRFQKPVELGVSPEGAVPATNIPFHYSEFTKTNRPVSIHLPKGQKSGYLRFDKRTWMKEVSERTCKDFGTNAKNQSVELKPGYYQFWNNESMPMETVATGPMQISNSMPGAYTPTAQRRSATPDKNPDFEIIVEEEGQA